MIQKVEVYISDGKSWVLRASLTNLSTQYIISISRSHMMPQFHEALGILRSKNLYTPGQWFQTGGDFLTSGEWVSGGEQTHLKITYSVYIFMQAKHRNYGYRFSALDCMRR